MSETIRVARETAHLIRALCATQKKSAANVVSDLANLAVSLGLVGRSMPDLSIQSLPAHVRFLMNGFDMGELSVPDTRLFAQTLVQATAFGAPKELRANIADYAVEVSRTGAAVKLVIEGVNRAMVDDLNSTLETGRVERTFAPHIASKVAQWLNDEADEAARQASKHLPCHALRDIALERAKSAA